jgi:nucleoside-diphosphate-sugar epimerase
MIYINMKTTFFRDKKVFVTGGAGFIGSTLVRKLIELGAIVTVGDNLSSGRIENLLRVWKDLKLSVRKKRGGYAAGKHSFMKVDFQNYTNTIDVLKGQHIVFHLAANIGGRGYIETHPADCCEGFSVNQNVIKAAHINRVERIVFASSACVYPVDLQGSYKSKYLLKEKDAIQNGWANADETYGWAKLMGEEILRAYHKQYGLKGACVRYVTAYGPWENDTHALIALIKRAVEKKDPYIIWGTGKQDRDFTFVEDIAEGTLMACQKVLDGSAVNIGTAKRYTIDETVQTIFKLLHWKPKKIVHDRTKPEGVKTRALDNKLARKVGWKARYSLKQGLKETIDWFVQTHPESVETIS